MSKFTTDEMKKYHDLGMYSYLLGEFAAFNSKKEATEVLNQFYHRVSTIILALEDSQKPREQQQYTYSTLSFQRFPLTPQELTALQKPQGYLIPIAKKNDDEVRELIITAKKAAKKKQDEKKALTIEDIPDSEVLSAREEGQKTYLAALRAMEVPKAPINEAFSTIDRHLTHYTTAKTSISHRKLLNARFIQLQKTADQYDTALAKYTEAFATYQAIKAEPVAQPEPLPNDSLAIATAASPLLNRTQRVLFKTPENSPSKTSSSTDTETYSPLPIKPVILSPRKSDKELALESCTKAEKALSEAKQAQQRLQLFLGIRENTILQSLQSDDDKRRAGYIISLTENMTAKKPRKVFNTLREIIGSTGLLNSNEIKKLIDKDKETLLDLARKIKPMGVADQVREIEKLFEEGNPLHGKDAAYDNILKNGGNYAKKLRHIAAKDIFHAAHLAIAELYTDLSINMAQTAANKLMAISGITLDTENTDKKWADKVPPNNHNGIKPSSFAQKPSPSQSVPPL